MGTRPRIVKPNAQQKAYAAVRELYSDIIDNLSNNECNMIIEARAQGLGQIFIVDIITRKRKSNQAHIAETERLWLNSKQKSPA